MQMLKKKIHKYKEFKLLINKIKINLQSRLLCEDEEIPNLIKYI